MASLASPKQITDSFERDTTAQKDTNSTLNHAVSAETGYDFPEAKKVLGAVKSAQKQTDCNIEADLRK